MGEGLRGGRCDGVVEILLLTNTSTGLVMVWAVWRRIVGLLLGFDEDAINVTQVFILTLCTCLAKVCRNEY